MSGETQPQPSGWSTPGLTPPPVPDPTTLTTAQIDRAIQGHTFLFDSRLDILRQRLDSMDRANDLLATDVRQVPTETDLKVSALKELHATRFTAAERDTDTRFKGVDKQFELLEKRTLSESSANALALAAALSAQKEAAAESKKASDLATDKGAKATSDAIAKLAELVSANIGGLTAKIDSVNTFSQDHFQSDSDRMSRIELSVQAITAQALGGRDVRGEQSRTMTLAFGALGALVGIAGVILAIIAFSRGA